MILKKDFYFIRHGQTDCNLVPMSDHPPYAPLNTTGRGQAEAIEPIIASLPIKTVCCSPLRRAQETRELITPRLEADHFEIEELGECGAPVWKEMYGLGQETRMRGGEPVLSFIEKVLRGVNLALSKKGPVLIVAHGGVHWALCSLLEVKEHRWDIDNCIPVHFQVGENGLWKVIPLI